MEKKKTATNTSYPAIAGSLAKAQNQTRRQLHRVATRSLQAEKVKNQK